MKERLYYWGTVVPLTAMLLYVHAEYRDQEKEIHRMIKIQNRQVELMGISHQKALIRLEKEFQDDFLKIEQHHREEVNEVIEQTQQMIDQERSRSEK